jgi:Rho-binding antiterminator
VSALRMTDWSRCGCCAALPFGHAGASLPYVGARNSVMRHSLRRSHEQHSPQPCRQMETRPYRPIDCSLHDRLEAAATIGKPVSVTYRAGDGTEVRVEDRIVDIVSSGGVEFVKLQEGTLIRLDDLVIVDGIPFAALVAPGRHLTSVPVPGPDGLRR